MKPRIFLLSVDRHVIAAVARVVNELRFEAFGTGDSPAAIAFLEMNLRERDILIVDLGCRGSGFATLDAIREFHEHVPWIAVTESIAEYIQALALINGAAEVLAKPVNPEELSRAVAQIREHGFRL
jgi:DNA-binding response OmpR family regulator